MTHMAETPFIRALTRAILSVGGKEAERFMECFRESLRKEIDELPAARDGGPHPSELLSEQLHQEVREMSEEIALVWEAGMKYISADP